MSFFRSLENWESNRYHFPDETFKFTTHALQIDRWRWAVAPIAGKNQNITALLHEHMTLRESNTKNEHKQHDSALSKWLRLAKQHASTVTPVLINDIGDAFTPAVGDAAIFGQTHFAGYTQSNVKRVMHSKPVSTIRQQTNTYTHSCVLNRACEWDDCLFHSARDDTHRTWWRRRRRWRYNTSTSITHSP